MRREQALTLIRNYEPQLRHRGVVRLRLFGSVARDEANEESDVDVMVDMDPTRQISLLDVGGVQQELAELLGTHVDVSEEPFMKERIRKRALREAVLAF